MHALHHKTHQRHLRRSQHAHAIACLKPTQQVVMQGGFVGDHRRGIQRAQVIQARAQADHAGNRWGAGFKAQRRGAKAGAVVVGLLHHLAAELPVAQVVQGLITAIQHADAVRAVEFVAGEHVEVAAQGLYVVAAMDDALGAVHHREGAMCLGQRQQGL